MSYIPGSDALSHPSAFARSVQVPGLGFTHATNGVPTNFALDIGRAGLNGLTTLYDGAKDYNSGATIANRPVTKQFGQRIDAVWDITKSGFEQPVFISARSV